MHIRDVCYLYVASNVVKIMFIALFQLHASYTMTVFSVCVNDTVSSFSARDELWFSMMPDLQCILICRNCSSCLVSSGKSCYHANYGCWTLVVVVERSLICALGVRQYTIKALYK